MKTTRPTPAARRTIRTTVCAALAACLLAGCNIVAPAYLIVHGPEKIPKAHALESARPTVVLVDVSTTSPVRPAVRTALADQLGQDLMRHAGVAKVLDARSAQSIASLDRYGHLTPVSEIGRSVGAEIVVQVMLESFTLTTDGQSMAPTATLRIKVIDAANESRLFPEAREGHPLTLARRATTATLPERGTAWNDAEVEFARWVGAGVAQLFYDHQREASHLRGR